MGFDKNEQSNQKSPAARTGFVLRCFCRIASILYYYQSLGTTTRHMNIRNDLQRWVIFGFALALCVLIGIDSMSYYTAKQYGESVEVVKRTHRAMVNLQSALADLVSAESEVRGYVITEDKKFLELHHRSAVEVEIDLKELDNLIYDPVNRRNLASFARLARARLARLQLTVETRQKTGFDEVRSASGPGKVLMDELRQVASQIEDRQNQLLSERNKIARTLAGQTELVIFIGSVFAVGLLVLSMMFLGKHIAQRERLEREVLEISEREQRRIGQDLHDGVCQQLTGVSLMSRSLQQKLTGSLAAEVVQITRLINEGIEQTRLVTRGLHPVPDEPMGLMVALKELVNRLAGSREILCRFVCDHPVPIPDRTAATNLYRITQEAVQNAIRHANPKNIEVVLKRDEYQVQLTVTDDGLGMTPKKKGAGLGLEIMNYRARSIGAALAVRSGGESGGTVITCTLPLDSLA